MPNAPTTAMIFAAGLGTRMRPLTNTLPKPMVEVAGKPMIDHAIDRLVAAGVQRIIINTYHLPDIIEQHCATRNDAQITFSRESEHLETGGGLVHARALLGDEPIYLMNADSIISADSTALLDLAIAWDATAMDEVMLLQPKQSDLTIGYDGNGDMDIDDEMRIIWPQAGEQPYVYTGISILNPHILDERMVAKCSRTSFWQKDDDLLPRNIGVIHQQSWATIDTVQKLEHYERMLRDYIG